MQIGQGLHISRQVEQPFDNADQVGIASKDVHCPRDDDHCGQLRKPLEDVI